MPSKLNHNAASINAKIKNLAKSKGVGISYVLDAFLLERMALRITTFQNLADYFVFKGGLVSLLVYGSNRFTVDVDAVLKGLPVEQAKENLIKALERPMNDGTWFAYESEKDISIQGQYGGKQLQFRGGIGVQPQKMTKARKLHLDIGIGDAIQPPPIKKETAMLIDEEHLAWQIYPIETIAAEKIHALISHGSGNSRSKDIYDLSILLPKCNRSFLREALKATFNYRDEKDPPNLAQELNKIDLVMLKKGWNSALVSVLNPPTIETTWQLVKNEISKS